MTSLSLSECLYLLVLVGARECILVACGRIPYLRGCSGQRSPEEVCVRVGSLAVDGINLWWGPLLKMDIAVPGGGSHIGLWLGPVLGKLNMVILGVDGACARWFERWALLWMPCLHG